MLSKLAAQCDQMDRLTTSLLKFQSPRGAALSGLRVPSPDLVYPEISEQASVHVPRLLLPEDPSPPSSAGSARSKRSSPRFTFRTSLYPIPERRPSSNMESREEGPEPLLKRKKKERQARINDPLHKVDWLNISPRTRVMKMVREDLPTLFDAVRPADAMSSCSSHSSTPSVVLVSPRNVSCHANRFSHKNRCFHKPSPNESNF